MPTQLALVPQESLGAQSFLLLHPGHMTPSYNQNKNNLDFSHQKEVHCLFITEHPENPRDYGGKPKSILRLYTTMTVDYVMSTAP